MRAIIIEDSPECMMLYTSFLELMFGDIEIEKQSHGLDGFNRVMEQKFSFIWTDLCMPYLGGASLIDKIRNMSMINRDTLVFAVSGDQDQLDALENAGYDNIILLQKPLSFESFQREISKHFVGRQHPNEYKMAG